MPPRDQLVVLGDLMPALRLVGQASKITAQHGVSFAEARRMLSAVDNTCDDLPKRTVVNTTSDSFVRNIVLEGTDTNKSLPSLSPFLLSKALQAAIGTVTSVKRFRTGHIPLTVRNYCSSLNLLVYLSKLLHIAP